MQFSQSPDFIRNQTIESGKTLMNTMTHSETSAPAHLNRLLSPIRLRGLRLLDLQLWCFGRDVKSGGDLLQQYGFEKHRLPPRVAGSPEYVFEVSREHRLTVWGYGIHWSAVHEGGLFLRRHAFSPRWTVPGHPPHGRWHVDLWRKARSPRTEVECETLLRHLGNLTSALADYEEWIQRTRPPEYRVDCLDRWHKESIVPATELASAWRELAAQHLTAIQQSPSEIHVWGRRGIRRNHGDSPADHFPSKNSK